ncbi:MAG: hypothetical protein IT215_05760 [Chitinophagaceae bacterium]|nr:hypothetical protein [Chitinophagaceae bacterium]
MKKIIIIVVAVIIIVILGFVLFSNKGSVNIVNLLPEQQQVSKLEPIDIVKDFYDNWLKAVQQPTTANPSRATLAGSPILSKDLRGRLTSSINFASSTDPVLCQTSVPSGISARKVFVVKDEAQIVITSKDKKVTNQALVNLNMQDGGWYINDIQCSLGEFAPEKEFSFENTGFLLKASIPKPYDPKNWHLIFEENGKAGNVVPLFFDANSQCIGLDGVKAVCKPSNFVETTKVFVRAQMTEQGASVKQMEFVK